MIAAVTLGQTFDKANTDPEAGGLTLAHAEAGKVGVQISGSDVDSDSSSSSMSEDEANEEDEEDHSDEAEAEEVSDDEAAMEYEEMFEKQSMNVEAEKIGAAVPRLAPTDVAKEVAHISVVRDTDFQLKDGLDAYLLFGVHPLPVGEGRPVLLVHKRNYVLALIKKHPKYGAELRLQLARDQLRYGRYYVVSAQLFARYYHYAKEEVQYLVNEQMGHMLSVIMSCRKLIRTVGKQTRKAQLSRAIDAAESNEPTLATGIEIVWDEMAETPECFPGICIVAENNPVLQFSRMACRVREDFKESEIGGNVYYSIECSHYYALAVLWASFGHLIHRL